MGRHRGIGRKRKGKKQGAPTPTKKSRMRVQQVSAEKAKKHLHDTREVENWITKMNEIASEAGVTAKKGLGYGAGEARIIIRAVINTIHARKGGLKWSTAKQQPQLQEVYDDMAGLFGMSHMVVRELFEDFIENKVITIKDESARGRGSVNAEPKRLRTNEQYAAIETFVDFCNSKAGGGKCTLEQIQKYMEEGPRLNSDDPQLDSGLRVHIPRSSLAYLLKKHLGYEFSYVNNNKTTNIMNTQKRRKIIWTPPYCPKFQPIELVWGAGKQRVAWGYFGSRNLEETRNQLRIGFYGGVIGEGNRERKHSKVDIAGCWKKAKGELNAWISKDCENIGVSGLSGDLDNLVGASNWTNSTDDCLDIQDFIGDLGVDVNEEQEADELADVGGGDDNQHLGVAGGDI